MSFLASSVSRSARYLSRTPTGVRNASTKSLRETLAEIVPQKQAQLKELVENLIGGMRGLKVMLWEGSVLDPNEGIRFHGHSIPDCQKVLTPAKGGNEIIAESMLWLLLTGKVPTEAQTRELSQELATNGNLPQYIEKLIDSFPRTLHPMTQLGMSVAALNHESKFAAAYEKGVKKTEYWTYALEDSLSLIAKLPALAARIYRNTYYPGKDIAPIKADQDLVGNYVDMLGYGDNEGMKEYLRLYIALHGDHEGGNVSAHTAHLVGSALSDPFLSYSASLFGLAGPLHGLANQEVLRWMLAMQEAIGPDGTHDQIKEYLWKTLKGGQVIPGYGHGVLRDPDPRFTALQNFCDVRPELKNSPIIQLVKKASGIHETLGCDLSSREQIIAAQPHLKELHLANCISPPLDFSASFSFTSEVAPGVLREHGKTKNPNPNVDATSEFKYYTVIFGVSRALGALTQLVWDRALGLPIERPKSLSMDAIEKIVNKS
ncbi:hypothetical protein FRC05_010655 [Tulasnella sp. 425]|nr:hypothetical protein FRC05_010655 [Tulasnella sp. 425]